ncbi:MAG: hypothetical protein QM762_14755 [Chryseolinea sp.]
MKRFLFSICIGAILCGCRVREEKPAIVELPVDQTLQLYGDVLNELVTKHFYNYYLGEDTVYRLHKKYENDTATLNLEIKLLRQLVESDTARQKSIYLNHILTHSPKILYRRFDADSSEYYSYLKSIAGVVTDDIKALSDSINSPQLRYGTNNFHPTSFKLSKTSREAEIGWVSFSKPVLNKAEDQAILYYEFYCGAKCGKGEILTVIRLNDKWLIKGVNRLWIY